MPKLPQPPKRRDPVAKALPRLTGSGPHRTGPTRADLKRELRRRIDQANGSERPAQ